MITWTWCWCRWLLASDQMLQLREMVLATGFNDDEAADASRGLGGCSVRGKVWKIFLGLGTLDAATYLDLVRRGKSAEFDQIAVDVARTFKTDSRFREVVTEAKLIRVLSAIDHWCKDTCPSVVRVELLGCRTSGTGCVCESWRGGRGGLRRRVTAPAVLCSIRRVVCVVACALCKMCA